MEAMGTSIEASPALRRLMTNLTIGSSYHVMVTHDLRIENLPFWIFKNFNERHSDFSHVKRKVFSNKVLPWHKSKWTKLRKKGIVGARVVGYSDSPTRVSHLSNTAPKDWNVEKFRRYFGEISLIGRLRHDIRHRLSVDGYFDNFSKISPILRYLSVFLPIFREISRYFLPVQSPHRKQNLSNFF